MAIIDAYRETYTRIRPPSYTDAWHLDEMLKVAHLCYEKRLWAIVEKSVRHGGSEVFNLYGPAIRLATNPREQFSLICAEQRLATKFSRATRSVLADPNYPVPYRFTQPEAANEWSLDCGRVGNADSTYYASGIEGMRQGRGCTVGIIDDIYKSGFVVKQSATREKYFDTIQNSVMNRLSPDGILFALGARIHPDDHIGHLLQMEEDGDIPPLVHLRLPATNDSGQEAYFRYGDDIVYFPYKEGALWPERFPRTKLDMLRKAVSEAWWQSQYQQSPNLAGKPYFNIDRVPRWDTDIPITRTWVAWDFAMTLTKSGSYSAGVKMGLGVDGRIYLLKVIRFRGTQEEMEAACWAEWEQSNHRLECTIVENAAAGVGIYERLRNQMPMKDVSTRGQSKEQRAGSVCALVNNGRVVFPKEGLFPWQEWFEEDVRSYPCIKQTDCIDALVYALAWPSMPGLFFSDAEQMRRVPTYEEIIDTSDPRHPAYIGLDDGRDDFECEFRRMLGSGGEVQPRTRSFGSEHERLDNNLLDGIDPERKYR